MSHPGVIVLSRFFSKEFTSDGLPPGVYMDVPRARPRVGSSPLVPKAKLKFDSPCDTVDSSLLPKAAQNVPLK